MCYRFFKIQKYTIITTLLKNLWSNLRAIKITLKHLFSASKRRTSFNITNENYFHGQTGTVTLEYPHEKATLNERARYKLHNDIEECIVCDKCVKVCPVNCIEIESIKSPVVLGYTKNGSAKRLHAAKFDIDLSKCCFCGLCTTVCPTDCLTTTEEYDYSVFDISEHKISFSKMTISEIENAKKRLKDL